MALYDFRCKNTDCGKIFEAFISQDERNAVKKCPDCSSESKKLVSYRQSKPTFTEQIYPFYHQGIGEVVHSESQLTKRCAELGFYSKHEGAYMTPKHERKILAKRVHEQPREVVEKVRWSGRGANLPEFETYDTGEGGVSEQDSQD